VCVCMNKKVLSLSVMVTINEKEQKNHKKYKKRE
jgi:hypothetical protein